LPNPKPSVSRNINKEVLELFWDRLSGEKKCLANPLQRNLQFAAGIRYNNGIVGIGGLKVCFGMYFVYEKVFGVN
jgi:hypothetical protein